jgi:hypothetical protein
MNKGAKLSENKQDTRKEADKLMIEEHEGCLSL